MKKIYLLISLLLLVFTIYLIILFKPRNYNLSYQINNLSITEAYTKKEGYLFSIKYKDLDYPLFIEKNYSRKRRHIRNISIYEEDQEICLNINAFNENFYICSANKDLKSLDTMSTKFLEKYNLKKSQNKKVDTYQSIDIYNKNLDYFVWNYKGYYLISNKGNKGVISFDIDNYQNRLSYQNDSYLIFPDYNSEYFFNKLYIYDTNNQKLNEVLFDYEISYDSYYLGDVNQNVYLIDKKNKNEYEINTKKNTIKKISKDELALIYNSGKWEEELLSKTIYNETKFTFAKNYNFIIENNKLYLYLKNYHVLISNDNVNKIVYINNNKVYYLVEDKLYSYEFFKQSELLLKYSEWSFNYNNHIFIFD